MHSLLRNLGAADPPQGKARDEDQRGLTRTAGLGRWVEEAVIASLRKWARSLRQQALVVYHVARDPRTPWFARILALAVAAYALSPIDFIPDFIPILGYLDDLVIVPLGLMLVLRLTPASVLAAAQDKAKEASDRPVGRGMAAVIIGIWTLAAVVLGVWAWGICHT